MSSPDPRVERTRRAVVAAARDVLLTDGESRLTLTAIAERAGYSRHAVYTNFTDMQGVLREVIVDALQIGPLGGSAAAEPLPDSELRERIVTLLRQMAEEREILQAISSLKAHPQLAQTLRQTAEEVFEQGRRSAGVGTVDTITTAFMVGGLVNLAHTWIHEELDVDAETLTDTTMKIVTTVRQVIRDR